MINKVVTKTKPPLYEPFIFTKLIFCAAGSISMYFIRVTHSSSGNNEGNFFPWEVKVIFLPPVIMRLDFSRG